MFVALNEAGCDVEFARYPGGTHDMLRVGAAVPSQTIFWSVCCSGSTDHLA